MAIRKRLKPAVRSNPILECATSLLAYMSVFRKPDRGARVNPKFRRVVMSGFDEFERKAFEYKIPMQIVKEAKYALCSYIDEIVLTSNWPGRLDWMAKPLQLEFFGEHVGGEGFFIRLNNLRQQGEQYVNLLEVYYVCLQLGFEGVYRMRGLEQLMALQVDLRSQIQGYRKYKSEHLSPAGMPANSVMAQMRREVPYWVIGTVTLASIFFTYLGYAVATDKVAEANQQAIAKNYQTIELNSTHNLRKASRVMSR